MRGDIEDMGGERERERFDGEEYGEEYGEDEAEKLGDGERDCGRDVFEEAEIRSVGD